MIDFQFKGKKFHIDATVDTGDYGRLLNHSDKSPNCKLKLEKIDEEPRILLVALKEIKPGEELLWDYGDRSQKSLKENPWLKDLNQKETIDGNRHKYFMQLLNECVYENNQTQELKLSVIKSYLEKVEKKQPFSDKEIDACIERMSDENKVMISGDFVYIIV